MEYERYMLQVCKLVASILTESMLVLKTVSDIRVHKTAHDHECLLNWTVIPCEIFPASSFLRSMSPVAELRIRNYNGAMT